MRPEHAHPTHCGYPCFVMTLMQPRRDPPLTVGPPEPKRRRLQAIDNRQPSAANYQPPGSSHAPGGSSSAPTPSSLATGRNGAGVSLRDGVSQEAGTGKASGGCSHPSYWGGMCVQCGQEKPEEDPHADNNLADEDVLMGASHAWLYIIIFRKLRLICRFPA